MFKPFGEITSAVIMKKDDGSSKGFGFVCFADSNSALQAIEKLNGKDGLFVGEAKSKAVRE